jgi:restriction system protein
MPDREEPPRIIPRHGGYRDLKSYQMAEIVYDATVAFCDRFVENIAEGSMASGTSKKTELKLVGVARASLEELLLDFEDYLRQHSFQVWGKDEPKAKKIRALAQVTNRSYSTYRTYFQERGPETAANVAICLIHQTNYLLDQQLRALEQEFLREGGFTERLYRVRSQVRDGRTRR